MIFDQFMPTVYRNTYFNVKRQTVFDYRNNDVMEDAERTPFGKRLYDARDYAELTQDQAAKAVGMAQGTLAEAEVSGKRSGYTVQLAALYKVNAGWLATGKGEMHPKNGGGNDNVTIHTTRDPILDDLALLPKEEADYYRALIRRDAAALKRKSQPGEVIRHAIPMEFRIHANEQHAHTKRLKDGAHKNGEEKIKRRKK